MMSSINFSFFFFLKKIINYSIIVSYLCMYILLLLLLSQIQLIKPDWSDLFNEYYRTTDYRTTP